MSSHSQTHREAEVRNVRSFATRSLDVLRAIDKTLDGLDENVTLLEGMVRDVESFQARLCVHGIDGRVDADGAIAGILEAAIEIVAHVHVGLQRTRAEMSESDGAVDRLDACVGLVRRLHSALAALHEWLATHDALLDAPLPGAYESADDLFKAIGIKP